MPRSAREERGTELGDQLLAGIAFVAVALAPEVPAEALRMLGPVREFMRERRGVALGIAERLERRHLHIVGAFGVIGAVAAVADVGAGRGEEPVGRFDVAARSAGQGPRPSP